ncbi:MAG TPA: hypothetical protein VEX43_05235 [Chthoniobacterales bacterium]|nr:hypothetical protein [Chthoniobacterales bacterium]
MSQPLAITKATDPDKIHPEDFPDIQGFILHGYNMPKSRHFVLTIGQVEAALEFLTALTSGAGALSITTAERWPRGVKPEYALNLGLTARGLEALELPTVLNINQGNFSSFLAGAVAAAPSVGDVGPNSPDNWVTKLNTANADRAHLLLSLYTNTALDRDFYSTQLREMFARVIPAPGAPDSDVLEWDVDPYVFVDPVSGESFRKIHFGYTDGISNPIIDEVGLAPPRKNQLPYVPAWQFVTRDGEYVTYNLPTPWEFGQNGTFSAFRILEQDVAAFDAFLSADGRDEAAQEYLASKLCGRWRNANPVVLRPHAPGPRLPDNELTDFDYGKDKVGEPCPYSAHTRRTNPRGDPQVVSPPGNKVDHRIMRRADAYGPHYEGKNDGQPRGLAGHFMCAMLANQFEFIMGQWVNNATFPGSAAQAGIDPLLGAVPDGSTFTYWESGSPVTVNGFSRFVTTRGGLYCFIPSITAVKWMAENGGASPHWTVPTTS